MRYIAAGGIMINDIVFADGREIKGYLGGTVYSANGFKTYDDSVAYVARGGPDWREIIDAAMKKYGYPPEGITCDLPHTIYSDVVYKPTGEWTEKSLYDDYSFADWRRDCVLGPEEIFMFCAEDTKGMYMEGTKGITPEIIREFHERCPGAQFMTELNTGWCHKPEYRDRVFEQIMTSDIYSLNLPVSMALFGTKSEEESVSEIIRIGKPCFFRVGTAGAYMILDGKAWFAPRVSFGEGVDATGCGNCSTAAALYCFAEGIDPLMSVIMSNIAAGINAAAPGPFDRYTPELRDRCLNEADRIFGILAPHGGSRACSEPFLLDTV